MMAHVTNGHLAYEISGYGPPVVLLHSGPLNLRMWDEQVATLAADYTVVRYDQRGYGRSSAPTKPFSHFDDLRQLLDHLNISRASLVGLSLGARTAVDFTLRFPEMVASLVLASPGLSGMVFSDPFIIANETAMFDAVSVGDVDTLVELQLRCWVDGPHRTRADVDTSTRHRCAQMILENLPAQAASRVAPSELRAIDRFDEIAVPATIIYGTLDSEDILSIVTRVGAHPNATARPVEDVGHHVNLERPADFNEIISDALAHR